MKFILVLFISVLAWCIPVPQVAIGPSTILEQAAGQVLAEHSAASVSSNTNKPVSSLSKFFQSVKDVFLTRFRSTKSKIAHVESVQDVESLAVPNEQPGKGFPILESSAIQSPNQKIASFLSTTTPLKYEDLREGVTVNGFKILKKLGSGEGGKVFKSQYKSQYIALKVYKHHIPPAELQLNKLLGRIPKNTGPFKVGEVWVLPLILYEDAKPLGYVLLHDDRYDSREARRALWVKARAQLELVYAKGFTYNDVHGKNFLVDGKGRVFIIDFGMARRFSEYRGMEEVRKAKEYDIADLSDEIRGR